MSTFRVDVVPVSLLPHPNADSLSLVRVFGYQCVVRTDDWHGRDRAAYIPPDSVVSTNRSEFAFLAKPGRETERVTVRRFRGTYSQGLLVPAPEGADLGDDVAEQLGVTHYEPPVSFSTGGEAERPPAGFRPVYDVESYHRYGHLLTEGEEVIVTEKIHGANGRFCCHDGRLWCGSRTEWKREDEKNLWWRALHASPKLGAFLVANPDVTAYGEVYGQVQDLKYGVAGVAVRLFDLCHTKDARWLDYDETGALLFGTGVATVPTLYRGPLERAALLALAEGKSMLADHVREGCVVKPVRERISPEIGRVQLKVVGNGYLERA